MKKFVAAVSCSVALLLAACGSDSTSVGVDPTTPATATTSTAAPSPTSSAAAAPTNSTTASTTAATEAVTPPAAETTDQTTVPTDSTESAVTTDSGTTESGPSGSGTLGSVTEFTPIASPVMRGSTMPVSADNRHPDGVYYASVGEGGDPDAALGSVVFEIVQLFTGPDCGAHFGEAEADACVNDYGIETDPTAYVEVVLDDQFIGVVDAATQQSYRISGAELHELILGGVPSDGAPADYVYSGFGFLVTYEGGEITRLEQWWTP